MYFLENCFSFSFQSPQEGEDDKMICCLCCASGPISARLRLDRSGYVPGEYITLGGEIDNQSTRKVKNIKLQLQMVSIIIF